MENYFLGSMAYEGFRSDFKRLIDADGVYTYILKGGAGTGKSSLMKKVASAFEDRHEVVRYFCSSDPSSLDAVYIDDAKALVVDGTSPHTFDPDFPAVKQEIVNLGDCWNGEKLKTDTSKIISVTQRHKGCMSGAGNYVSAITSIMDDTYSLAETALLRQKLETAADKISDRFICDRSRSGKGEVSLSLLSAVTPQGYVLRTETLSSCCDKLCLIADEYYCASDILLKRLADNAVKKGYDIIVGKCNLFTQSVYEAVMIKELGLAFAAVTPINAASVSLAEQGDKKSASRFYDKKLITEKRSRLKMNKSACTKLLEETVQTLSYAKTVHDDIEKYYISAMDFGGVDDKAKYIISEVNKRLSV